MASYNTSANIEISINGRQAQQMMATLDKDARRLETQIAKAASAGDKAKVKKLTTELNRVKRMMDQLNGSTQSVEQTLQRLDRATPKELNKALQQLKRQLDGMQRGSEAWNRQCERIRRVREEIGRCNAELREQQGLVGRVQGWFDKWSTSIMAAGAALFGLVDAGRKAVNAYAEMDESIANTMKFTGMTKDQVDDLNEAFKRMDTRTARETLNDLAQEAGRLGKNSKEDVLGYVQAADIINVALSDLGQGATQSIAKLSNIFKLEDQYGTYDSMVKIGSVVNVLSQNCTASKPYLVEFANRLAGVGNQAHISLQNIIGFGAVLDANAQKVEASATAVGQVLTRMYRDPAKYATVAGIDVQKFTNLLKTDANEALLVFLETLGKAGDMDVLSPMFADMGENGARVITALSTLSKHIDEVRWQQENANKAFDEGTSVLHEYEIFNNTAQAGIDKARKRMTELSIELGEKLMPVMSHVYTSGSIFLRVLSHIVDFVIRYKGALAAAALALTAYAAAANAAAVKTAALNVITKSATALKASYRAVVLLLDIALSKMSGNATRAAAATKLLNAACKVSPVGLLAGAITAAAGAMALFISKARDTKKATEEAARQWREWSDSLVDISKESAQAAAAEEAKLKSLYDTATDAARSTDQRRMAAENLQKLYPDYFANLSTEQIMVGEAADAYENLRKQIVKAARAKAAAAKIEQNEAKLIELEEQEENLREQRDKDKSVLGLAEKKYRQRVAPRPGSRAQVFSRSYNAGMDVRDAREKADASDKAYSLNLKMQEEIKASNKKLAQLTIEVAPDMTEQAGNGDNNGPSGSAGGTGKTSGAGKKDKFAVEKDWRESQEALLRIDYATGVRDYVDYIGEMDRIAVEFCEKQLAHTDLTELERLKITADWRDAQKKQQERFDADTIEQENVSAAERKAVIIQAYIDGEISKASYDIKIEEAEIEHQRRLVSATKEGTRDRAQAEQQLQSLLLSQSQRRQQEREKLEAKYAAMKKSYFGDNPREAQSKLDDDLDMLKIIYDREIEAAGENAAEKLRIDEAYEQAKLALKKKYGLEAETDTRNAMQKAVAASAEWLQSDGGKAVTGSMDTLVSGMSAIFSQLSSGIQAELEMQTASVNKRYDAELSRAEGNAYRIRQIEKRKEKELAQLKSDANRKMFAMQVIQAVAQTATNALNAYGSAAAIPVVGLTMAPIAAAAAVAAGMMQVAAIRKQQAASEAQGYAEGGFTRPGRKYEPAGIVHAGEWVASQTLVNNPATRPLIEALDYAQRTNTVGRLAPADVSGSPAVPVIRSRRASGPAYAGGGQLAGRQGIDADLADVIRRLAEKLDEPFVTVNTMTGDHGILETERRYERLMRNKNPKNR